MLRRLLLGLLEGLAIGLALSLGSARWLGLAAANSAEALLLGAAAGLLVGLIAGRPVWAREAKTEALLKAVVGAVGGAGLSLAAGHWLTTPLDLSAYRLGVGPLGMLSTVTLPLVATVLALFFELDDSPSTRGKARLQSAPRLRLPSDGSSAVDETAEFGEAGDETARTARKH